MRFFGVKLLFARFSTSENVHCADVSMANLPISNMFFTLTSMPDKVSIINSKNGWWWVGSAGWWWVVLVCGAGWG